MGIGKNYDIMKTEKLKGASTMKESKYAGTETEKNLMAAFAGESEARNKYDIMKTENSLFMKESHGTIEPCQYSRNRR